MTIYTTQGLKKRIEGLEEAKNSQIETSKKKKEEEEEEEEDGEGNGNPLQYSCLENTMDRGAWRTIVHGVPKKLDMT